MPGPKLNPGSDTLEFWMLDYVHESGHNEKDVIEVLNDIDDVTLIYRDGLTTTIPWEGRYKRSQNDHHG